MPPPAARLHGDSLYGVHRVATQFLIFGFFVCMDGFLHNLTYLPMRFAMAVVLMVAQPFVRTCVPHNEPTAPPLPLPLPLRVWLRSTAPC